MKKILIFSNYFYPAYKAGGPIQSIANLCRSLKDEYKFYIITSNHDHGEKDTLSGIKNNEWNDFENGTAIVYYLSSSFKNYATIKKLIRQVNADVLIVTGLFSPLYSILPLFYCSCKKILSVRGMLHPGALSQKRLKKKLFISLINLSSIPKKVIFHATDKKEGEYVIRAFGTNAKVIVAQNFSNKSVTQQNLVKERGKLKLISIGLISPMKNHALVLEALKHVNSDITYDIYGPVKDVVYWEKCLHLINEMSENVRVNYKGSIKPNLVEGVLSDYHCFILPSKSENFGHAIYEALTIGLPVITSNYTPWNDLKRSKAGWNVDISNIHSIINAIEAACLLDEASYRSWSKAAMLYAAKNINLEEVKKQNMQLLA